MTSFHYYQTSCSSSSSISISSCDANNSNSNEISPQNYSTSSIPSSLTSHTQNNQCVATLKSHNSYPSSLALAGKFLFTGSSDREIRMWKCPGGGTATAVAGKGAVKSLVVLSEKILFSAHQDHKIRVWKINNPKSDGHDFTQLATLPILSDRAIKFLQPKNHVQIRRHRTATWVHHVDTVSALALSTDQSLLYSVSWDRTLKIWSTVDFKCTESIENAHDDAINALAVSRNSVVYTGSTDKKIKVWGKIERKHSLIATLEKHNSGINALSVDTNGSIMYSGSCDKTVMVWWEEDLVVVCVLRGHKKSILCLAVVGDLVCSGSEDKTIRIWRGVERSCYSCIAVLVGHCGPVKCLAAAAEEESDCNNNGTGNDVEETTASSYVLYSGGIDGDTKVWQIFVLL